MLNDRMLVWIFSIAIAFLGAGAVSGQNYPNKNIRIVTGNGTGSEFLSRLIAQGITGSLGQPVIVEGRSVVASSETVAKATPDGYTILVSGQTHWISPLMQKVPYDPVKEFSPITYTDISPSIMVVHPSLSVKSVKEFIALAKAKPGQLNYPAVGVGSATHLATELFKAMAGVNIVHVPYQITALALSDLLGGQTHVRIGGASSVVPHVKTGKLLALGVSTAEPSALFPGLPTIAASGLPGYEASSINGVFAPAKTPTPIINRLNQEIVRYLKTAEAKEKIIGTGSEAAGSIPEELAAYVKSDMAKFGKVVRDAGIRVD